MQFLECVVQASFNDEFWLQCDMEEYIRTQNESREIQVISFDEL